MDFKTAKQEFNKWLIQQRHNGTFISMPTNNCWVLLNKNINNIRDVYMSYDMIIEFLEENKFVKLENTYYQYDKYLLEIYTNGYYLNGVNYTSSNLIDYLKAKLGLYNIKLVNKYDLY
jgi:hypothetical protein